MIRKIVGWPLAKSFYFIGDKVSIVMEKIDTEGAYYLLYPIYNWFMCKSCDINNWAQLKLWR